MRTMTVQYWLSSKQQNENKENWYTGIFFECMIKKINRNCKFNCKGRTMALCVNCSKSKVSLISGNFTAEERIIICLLWLKYDEGNINVRSSIYCRRVLNTSHQFEFGEFKLKSK